MLRELITWALNTYLGKYLENLNSVQLSVALLSGEVELENIPIRKDALRALNLPVEVAGGSIRKIKLQVPVRQFRTSPWCISVEGLFCIICPKNLESWDYAKEKLQDLQYKLAVLDNAEAGWRSEKGMQMESYYFSSYNNWLKYGTNMATNIIDNIELKIFDVHFRYEDSVDVGKTKIATGIKIASLTAQTCDSNWTSGSFKAANNEMNYKLVELKELSVYWDILHEDIRCQSFTNQDVLNKLHSTLFKMRMASVSYTHCPRFLQDVNACVTYFKRSLREFFTSIGNKATDMAMEFVQQIRATDVNDQTRPVNPQKNRHDNRLDIIINSPIILLPISSTSTHVLIANLGKMTCSNMIVNDSNEFDESYTIAIKNIYVYSMTIDERENCFNVHPSKNKDAIPILHDTAITLQLSVGYSEGNGNGEERKLDTVSIEGSMVETLKVSLNRKRYELLNESIQYATNFSNGKAIESAHPDPSGVSIPDSDITDEHTICTIIQFSVPVFQINLQNQHHDDLINITFKDFNVKHRVKGYDKDIEIILKSVLMEDLKSDNTSPFRNMVTSVNLEKGQKKNASTSSSCPDIPTHCNYRKYRSTSEPSCFQENNPFQNFDGAQKSEFSKKNDKGSKRGGQTLVTYNSHRGRPSKGTSEMDQFSSIQFNCLNLAICVERWYTIFDFFGLIAAENDNQKVTQEKKLVKKDTNDFFSTLKVSIRSFNFTLIRNDSLLSRVNVSNALFKIIHDQFGKSIEGHLGSLSVFDLTQYGNIYKQKFVTSGTEALNFFYRKKPCDVEVLKTLSVDSTLKIGMSAVHYIHTKRFATELHLFVKDLLQLQTWCKSFSMHKDLSHRELRAENTKGSYAIGISVRRGRGLYACTTFLTLSPRFHLHNRSGYILEFIQRCDIVSKSSSNIISAPIDCNFAFHWPNWDQEQYICVRIPDVECCCWSKGIPINEVQSLYINVRNDWSEMFFLRLEVISKDATYILLFTDARTLPPPIRIDNCSEVAINFSQTGTRPSWITPVRAQSSLAYVMDDPSGTQTLLLEAPGGNMVEFPINKTNIKRSLTYSNFIYIAFHDTFDQLSNQERKPDQNYQQLVLGVRGKKVIIMEKNSGDRSQLWLMNSNGQLEHEGSTPPIQSNEAHAVRLVLDLDRAPNPTEFTTLVVRTPNKQRITTQTWRFESGRLMCHANMCVQSRWSANGLQPNSEAVLGRIENTSGKGNNGSIPMSQHIVAQKLRPGSGQLELSMKMDGPICTIEICDIKTKQNTVYLAPDLIWMHASLNNRQMANEGKESPLHEYLINVELLKGIGISIISRKPCEELMFISLELIHCDLEQSVFENSLDLTISSIQIDNQLLDAATPVALHTNCSTEQDEQNNAVVLKLKMLPCPNKNAIIFKYLTLDLKSSIAANLEEKLILKVASFLGYGKSNRQSLSVAYDFENFEEKLILKNMKRYYFENLNIGSTQVRLSASTSSKLPIELSETKKVLGLTLIKFEDAQIELDSYSDKFHFETLNVYLKGMKRHYINQVKWHAASILGSVDFLGNPLGFANDLSEGVSGLIFEGSVTSLVKNVAHGLSNSTAKLTETLSDSLGKVVLDEHDNETRLRILEPQTNTSGGHLAAGLKGFGFGLLGGVTSIVRHTYDGAQSDGVPGFLSGLGKGLVGTVTKPIIGVLDLASETASAVRETSRGTARISPDRKRLPRCVTGATGGLLPLYSNRQSKGQQLLYLINRRNFDEKIIAYDPNLWSDKEARLRLLVSTEFVRIFSFTDGNPTIMLQSHLSEILSCHPLTTNMGTSPSTSRQSSSHYIEISTNLPKITRPRIRCRSEECAEAASRCINYAKSVFHEHEHAVL
ncbi:GL25209 [Drosophila persimilis]|uniref:GL25209 n=1 Tax=Drosophila persimilis TaxID=7234 RepID=B4GRI4_DROPE|nr:GL25209 [Drosophila persimilis]